MLPSPVMKFDGEKLERNQYQFGPKMNHNESFAIINGFLVTTYSYLDIELRQKRKKFEENPMICKYFVDRKSIFSDYLYDEDKLEKSLKILEKDPIYLLMILIPGSKHLTPFDEAIEHHSPKVVEMLLASLINLTDFNISNLLKHQFPKLLSMGLESFRNYINLCYLTTDQMNSIEKTSERKLIKIQRFSSDSLILDSNFYSKIGKNNKEVKKASKIDEQSESQISSSEMGVEDKEVTLGMSKNEIKISVKAIEFNWILKPEEGKNFLENLSETKSLDYFQIDLVKDIIVFQWESIR